MLENYLKNILSKYVRLADTRNTHFWLLWGKTRTTHWYNALHSLMASTIDSNCISFPRLDTHRHVWISLSFRRFCKKSWHVVCSCGDRIQHCLRTRGPSDLDFPSKSVSHYSCFLRYFLYIVHATAAVSTWPWEKRGQITIGPGRQGIIFLRKIQTFQSIKND